MKTRKNELTVTAIVIWLIYSASLWPLPPSEAKHYIDVMKQGLTRSPSPEVKAEREWKEAAADFEKTKRKIEAFIENADAFEATLWITWAEHLTLLVFGLMAWISYWKRWRFWKAFLVTSSVLYIVLNGFFNSIVYTSLADHWLHGSTGFAFLPWPFVLFTIYYNFAMPLLLVLAVSLAFRWRDGDSLTEPREEQSNDYRLDA